MDAKICDNCNKIIELDKPHIETKIRIISHSYKILSIDDYDFCSKKCFLEFIDKKFKEVKK